jgi:hypothetical protein
LAWVTWDQKIREGGLRNNKLKQKKKRKKEKAKHNNKLEMGQKNGPIFCILDKKAKK